MFNKILNRKTYWVFHPDSPGEKILVTRSWLGRLFKPIAFATLTETMKFGVNKMNKRAVFGEYQNEGN